MSFLTLTAMWFVSGLIMSSVFVYICFNKWNRGYATWGDIYVAIFILLLGPIAMLIWVLSAVYEWLDDRSHRIAFQKIKWTDDD